MQRVKTPFAVADKPPYDPTGTPGYFSSGNPLTAQQPTVPGAQWFNMTQEEIVNVILAAGLELDPEDDTQLAQAIAALIAAQAVTVPSASTTVEGIIRQSTGAQAVAGTDDTTAMSPADVTSRLTAQWIAAATVTDFNTLTKPCASWVVIYNAANTNAPVSGNIYWLVECNSYSATYLVQRAQSLSSTDSQAFVRVCNNGTWSAWRRLAVLDAVQGYTRQQYPVRVVRTGQSGNQAVDCDLHQALYITATGAITMQTPTNVVAEKEVRLRIYSAGAQTISWASGWAGTSYVALPTVTVAGKWLRLVFVADDDGVMGLVGYSVRA